MNKNFCCIGKLAIRALQENNSSSCTLFEGVNVSGVISALKKKNGCTIKTESEYFKERDKQLLLKMASSKKEFDK